MSNEEIIIKCPNCKDRVSLDSPFLPYCSGLCAIIDMNKRLSKAEEKLNLDESPYIFDKTPIKFLRG